MCVCALSNVLFFLEWSTKREHERTETKRIHEWWPQYIPSKSREMDTKATVVMNGKTRVAQLNVRPFAVCVCECVCMCVCDVELNGQMWELDICVEWFDEKKYEREWESDESVTKREHDHLL